jgi:carboxypeptidase C (cathepsin A)
VLWFNGGPGCSSLDGFFYEMGPFEIASDYKTLVEREYRWNSIVNMLYIEAPVGVGFSYSDTNDYKCSDDRTASENLAAVEAFYSMFPEYKANKFFITGESYAGIYVPTLAEAIVNAEKANTYTGAKLTGIAVGNGCTGTEVGICGSGPQVRSPHLFRIRTCNVSVYLIIFCRVPSTSGLTLFRLDLSPLI